MKDTWPHEGYEPVVGWWYSRCCEQDLYQIETEEELADVLTDWREDVEEFGGKGGWAGFWPTRAEALDALVGSPDD